MLRKTIVFALVLRPTIDRKYRITMRRSTHFLGLGALIQCGVNMAALVSFLSLHRHMKVETFFSKPE